MATKKNVKKKATAKKTPSKKRLKRYQEKRDFTKTPEPSGDEVSQKARAKGKDGNGLFFCVQKHLASHLHYDFRLEHRGVLLSWAVPKGPSLRPSEKRLAMRVEDHPWSYKDFEGVIPSGYGAGVVMLWEQGTWAPEEGFENVDAALAKGELKFTLEGVKLKGSWVLVRAGEKTTSGERERWLLMKHRDEWAGDVDIATVAPNSVKTNRDFEEIVKSQPEVWDSDRPGGEDLQAIVRKVMTLKESSAGSENKTATTARKKSRH